MMVDADNRANDANYGSRMFNRVNISVMTSEFIALLLGFDCAFMICYLLEDILFINIGVDEFVDSKTILDFIAKDVNTT